MRDDERGIDFAFLYALQQNRQIMLYRRLSHAKRESTIDRGTHWNFIDETAIDANDRDGSEIAAAMNRLAQNMRPICAQKDRNFYAIDDSVEAARRRR